MDATRLILGGAAATGLGGLLVTAFADPTQADVRRLDKIAAVAKAAPRLKPPAQMASLAPDLTGRPIFVMTTGAGAYTEKTLRLFGVAISPGRKAALISVDGAQPVWIRVGEMTGDMQLIDVDGRRARIDTPVGERTVGLNDAAPDAANTGG